MAKKFFASITMTILIVFMEIAYASAATAVLVFAPKCKYIGPNFRAIALAMISPYFDEVYSSEEIDEEYSTFSPISAKHFDERFAEVYGCDYLIQIYTGTPTEWKGTHLNVHTGQATRLGTVTVSTHMVTACPATMDYYSGVGAGYSSNHGEFRNLDKISWDLHDESFVENLAFLVEAHNKHMWHSSPLYKRSKELEAQELKNDSAPSPEGPSLRLESPAKK